MNVYVRALATRARPGRRRVRRAHPARAPRPARRRRGRARLPGGAPRRRARRRRCPSTTLIDLVEPMVDATIRPHAERGRRATTLSTPTTGSRARSATGSSTSSTVPLVATFHTLARVKADAGIDDDPALRSRIEHEIDRLRRPDARVDRRPSSEQLARLYGADVDRIEIVPPGRRPRDLLARCAEPSARRERAALGLGDGPALLFVGRIQPLKGADLAVAALAELGDPGRGAARRRRAERPRRPGGAGPSCTRWSTSSASATRCGSSRRSRTRDLATLLPRRRRLPRPEPQRVVRAGRARGRGVRHAGGRGRGRRAALARRRRRHRLPRRQPRPGRLRRADRAAARRSRRCRGDGRERRGRARAGTRGASPPPGCAGCTRTCSCASPSRVADARRRRRSPRRTTLIDAHLCGSGARPRTRSSTSSTTRSCAAGTCASVATAATRPRSTSICTSARCATSCTSCPRPTTRPALPALHAWLLRRNHDLYGARFSLGPDGDVYLTGRVALEHLTDRGARPDHRRALRADRAVVPGRGHDRLPLATAGRPLLGSRSV